MKAQRCILTALSLFCCASALHAQVPNLVNYQGRVAVGTPAVNFDGVGQFRFSLVNATGTTTYWSNSPDTTPADGIPDSAVSLSVTKGLFSVLLGDTSVTNMGTIPASVWSNADLRLRVWFNDATNGLQLLTPDQRLTPVGYLADAAVTSGKIAAGAVGAAQLSSNLTLGGSTTGTFTGDGAGLTNLNLTGATNLPPNPLQIALLKWGPNKTTSFAVGGNPLGVAFDGANIWVANNGSGTVTKLLANTGTLLGTYTVGGGPYGIAFDGENIWVANSNSNTVTKLLASTGAVLGTYTVGAVPTGVAFDGANIWVANLSGNTVTKLLASTGAIVGTYAVGSGPNSIAFDGANIWVVNQNSSNVTKLVASTGAAGGTYSVGSNPNGVAFDGANIWVGNYGSNTVTKLLAGTGAVLGTYAVGTGPSCIAFDGANIWVGNYGSNTVTKLLAGTGAVIGTYAVGSKPNGVAFDGVNIWVANFISNSLNKL